MTHCLVVSAVNLNEGGPLTILRDCLNAASNHLPADWEIIALVNDASLVDEPRVRLVPVPAAKRSWVRRLYYEWWDFQRLSSGLQVDLWLSLHDLTPRVEARRQVVYCHNPAPFYRISLREAWLEPKLLLFNQFYSLMYGLGIRRNHMVVVQQEWLRTEFLRRFDVSRVVVAHPNTSARVAAHPPDVEQNPRRIFLYPALPRVFKNFEVLCEAAIHLHQAGVTNFEIRMTIDGSENPYSRYLMKRYREVPGLAFIGRQGREGMARQYAESDCLLFPSKLETWGLPISEAKALDKPMLVADLPYAYETVGNYRYVDFFDPEDGHALSQKLTAFLRNEMVWKAPAMPAPPQPFAGDWPELLKMLVDGL